jgi:hypothetical protein
MDSTEHPMTVRTEPVTWISPAVPDQELLAAIGELVVVHVHLDHMLKMTIKSLLGIAATVAKGSSSFATAGRKGCRA